MLGLIFAPAWTWALWDAKDPVDLGLFHITNIWTALAATAIGIAIAPLALALVRGPAAATGSLARALLAPRTEELEERVEVLQATRAGAVDAAAAELERIERDLHDGAQARLVAIAMDLGLAQQKLDDGSRAGASSCSPRRATARAAALVELRDLARGIRPALLAERGLAEAVRAFAARSPVPATVTADLGDGRDARAGRVGRLLRRRRGADQRRQARAAPSARPCRSSGAARRSRCSSSTTATAAPTRTAAG